MNEYKPGGIKIKQWTDEDMEYLDRQNLKLENDIKLLNKAIKALAEDSVKLENSNIELKKEIEQQRFNNKHNLSIDQKIADELVKLKEQVECMGFYEATAVNEITRLKDLLKQAKPWMAGFDNELIKENNLTEFFQTWVKNCVELLNE